MIALSASGFGASLPLPPFDPRDASDTGATRLKQLLQQEILNLSYPAFEHLMQRLLIQCGYNRVGLIGRQHQRGRTRQGGLDMTAYTNTDVASALTIAQVKQYHRPVSRRFVDELRGTMLRLNAAQGLIVTTSTFSKIARRSAAQSQVAPIRLIDGEEMLGLLIQHQLGIQEKRIERLGRGESNIAHWAIDKAFFATLHQVYPQRYPQRQATLMTSLGSRVRLPTLGKPEIQSDAGSSGSVVSDASADSRVPTGKETRAYKAINSKKGGGMTWSTHVLIGINALWVLELLPLERLPLEWLPANPELTNIGFLAGIAALGALLPDLDAGQSKIKHLSVAGIKPFFLPAQAIHQQFGHRSFLHSLAGLAGLIAVALPLSQFWGWPASLILVLGYASHLMADACTKSGIPVFYPTKRRYHLLPRSLRVTTDSGAEDVLFILLSVSVLLLLLRHLLII